MERIVVTIFFLLIIPYVGLPRYIDVWIVLVLLGFLVYGVYRLIQDNGIKFSVLEDQAAGGLARDLEQEKKLLEMEQQSEEQT